MTTESQSVQNPQPVGELGLTAQPPDSTAAMFAELERLDGEIEALFSGLPLDVFFACQGDHWSPSEHLRHLSKSVAAVTKGLRVPKPVLLLRFGPAFKASRNLSEVAAAYALVMAQGAGRFSPSSKRAPAPTKEGQRLILERWNRTGRSLRSAAVGWSDVSLDRLRMPHPLLGKMTVRELLLFTLLHNSHHARRVLERLTSLSV